MTDDLHSVAILLKPHASETQTHWIHKNGYDLIYEVPSVSRDAFFKFCYTGVCDGTITISENPKIAEHRIFSDWDFSVKNVANSARISIIKEAIRLYNSLSLGVVKQTPNGAEPVIESAPVIISLEINTQNGNVHLKTNIRCSTYIRNMCNIWVKTTLQNIPQFADAADALDVSTGVRLPYCGKYRKDADIDRDSYYVPISLDDYFADRKPDLSRPKDAESFAKLCNESSVYNLETFVDPTEYRAISGEAHEIACEYIARQKHEVNVPDETWRSVVEIAKPYMSAFAEPTFNEAGILRYERKTPSMCPICERTHDSNGMYITLNPRTYEIQLRCFQMGSKFYSLGFAENTSYDDYTNEEIWNFIPTTTASKEPPKIVAQNANYINDLVKGVITGREINTNRHAIFGKKTMQQVVAVYPKILTAKEINKTSEFSHYEVDDCEICANKCQEIRVYLNEKKIKCIYGEKTF